MNNRMRFALMVLLGFLSGVFPGFSLKLPELMKPESMTVSSGRVYVAEKGSVLVFDITDGRLVKKFGKRGEGPGEFTGVIRLHVVSGKILVSSPNKISLFSPEGKLEREARTKEPASNSGGFLPFGNLFIGAASIIKDGTGFRTVNLYDRDLVRKNEIFRTPVGDTFNSPDGKLNFFKTAFSYRGLGDLIFVSGEEGFVIRVFDQNGSPVSTIKRDYIKIPFTSADKTNFLNYLKSNSPVYVFERMSDRLVFPEYFPVIFLMVSDETTLYVFTWKRTGKGLECFLYDSKGIFLSRQEIPLAFESPVMFYPFSITGGKLYQLVENDEEEIWELLISEI